MIRAHPRRSLEGDLDGLLRSLPQFVAQAKPALEADDLRLSGNAVGCSWSNVVSDQPGMSDVRGPALPAQFSAGRFQEGGEARLRVESTPRVRPAGAALQLDPSHPSIR